MFSLGNKTPEMDGSFLLALLAKSPLLSLVCGGVDWTDYSDTSSIVGWSSYTYKSVFYKKIGKLVFVQYYISGTSNSAAALMTVPFVAVAMPYGVDVPEVIWRQDNGSSSFGLCILNDGTNSVSFFPTANLTSWQATGNKTVAGRFWYQAG